MSARGRHGYGSLHGWLDVPRQSRIWSGVRLALLLLVVSRHLPDARLTSCPLVCACQVCVAAAVQADRCGLVPLAEPVTSRHPPRALTVPSVPIVQVWAALPLQVSNWIPPPAVPLTSAHLPTRPVIRPLPPPAGGPAFSTRTPPTGL